MTCLNGGEAPDFSPLAQFGESLTLKAMPPKNLGAIERPKDPRDIMLGAVQAPTILPATLGRNLSWLQRNYQGETPFCGEHAGAHLKAVLDYYGSNGSVVTRKSPRYGTIKLKDPKSWSHGLRPDES